MKMKKSRKYFISYVYTRTDEVTGFGRVEIDVPFKITTVAQIESIENKLKTYIPQELLSLVIINYKELK